MTAPLNAEALRRAVEEAARRRAVAPKRMQYTVASTIALQMIPDGAAKGGGAIRQRVSETEARLTTDLDFARAAGIAEIFNELGLPQPAPVRVISAEHQIVQKLHACTGEAARGRAHDLIDIQILAAIEDIDHTEIGRIGRRLFAYRQRHDWPPIVIPYDGWTDLYAAALADLDNEAVRTELQDAVDFTNRLIEAATGSM
jgi:Nucleotidyl transferase AbiEii toxin, Type IV TA system